MTRAAPSHGVEGDPTCADYVRMEDRDSREIWVNIGLLILTAALMLALSPLR